MKTLTVCLCAASLSACASFSETFHSDRSDKIYAGVRTDWQNIVENGCGGAIACEGLNPIVDLPFSAIGDTILLPYTLSVSEKVEKSGQPTQKKISATALPAGVPSVASRPRRT